MKYFNKKLKYYRVQEIILLQGSFVIDTILCVVFRAETVFLQYNIKMILLLINISHI